MLSLMTTTTVARVTVRTNLDQYLLDWEIGELKQLGTHEPVVSEAEDVMDDVIDGVIDDGSAAAVEFEYC